VHSLHHGSSHLMESSVTTVFKVSGATLRGSVLEAIACFFLSPFFRSSVDHPSLHLSYVLKPVYGVHLPRRPPLLRCMASWIFLLHFVYAFPEKAAPSPPDLYSESGRWLAEVSPAASSYSRLSPFPDLFVTSPPSRGPTRAVTSWGIWP